MATPQQVVTSDITLEIPEKQKCAWLKEVFEFTDTEMAYVLGVSVETLRKWIREDDDLHALEAIRFHRLLNLTQLAKGVIRSDRLGHWFHHPNAALGKITPISLLADGAGYEMVSAVVEDLRMGISD